MADENIGGTENKESEVKTELKMTKKTKKDPKKESFSENVNKVTDKFKENIDKIDWSNIVYEDEAKQIPLVTAENIDIFTSITNEFVGDMDINSWVSIAKQELNEYVELKSRELDLDVDELKYLHSMEDTAKSSKELLALIQFESKNLAKDFEENKIAETAIKAATIKTLHDFIIKRYPIINEKEKFIDQIEQDITKHMYVIPTFRRLIDRETVKIGAKDYNRFSSSSILNDAFDYTCAISTYLKMLDSDSVNIDLSALLAKDFEFMNFFVIVTLYSVYKKANPDFVLQNIKNIDEKTLESLNKTMDLDGHFTSIENGPFDKINKVVDQLSSQLHDIETVDKILKNIDSAIVSDKVFKYWKENIVSTYTNENKEIPTSYKELYTLVLAKIVENIPEIDDNKIGNWSKYYRIIRILNLYLTFADLRKILNDTKVSNEQMDSAVFNVIMHLAKREYDHNFSNLVVDLNSYIKETVNSADSRDIFFKTSMNFLNTLHSFGFKSHYTQDYNIYELAKEKMGEKLYQSTIVAESEDIILKDVDLTDTKNEYYNLVLNVLTNLVTSIDNL